MALLPNVPFVSIEDFRVAVDAPLSTDLLTDIAIDINFLNAMLTGGAIAPATLNTNNIIARGTLQVFGFATFSDGTSLDALIYSAL